MVDGKTAGGESMNDVFYYWELYCNGFCDASEELCYWKYYIGDIAEEFLVEWEREKERAEFMSDWEEYVGEF